MLLAGADAENRHACKHPDMERQILTARQGTVDKKHLENLRHAGVYPAIIGGIGLRKLL